MNVDILIAILINFTIYFGISFLIVKYLCRFKEKNYFAPKVALFFFGVAPLLAFFQSIYLSGGLSLDDIAPLFISFGAILGYRYGINKHKNEKSSKSQNILFYYPTSTFFVCLTVFIFSLIGLITSLWWINENSESKLQSKLQHHIERQIREARALGITGYDPNSANRDYLFQDHDSLNFREMAFMFGERSIKETKQRLAVAPNMRDGLITAAFICAISSLISLFLLYKSFPPMINNFKASSSRQKLMSSIVNIKKMIPASKKCPFCAEKIKPEATVCKHCKRDLAQ